MPGIKESVFGELKRENNNQIMTITGVFSLVLFSVIKLTIGFCTLYIIRRIKPVFVTYVKGKGS
jgi:hypothetical protein